MAKGSKRNRWYKDGIKISRKYYKKFWNREVRRTSNIMSRCEYKKLAAEQAFNTIY